MQLQVLCILGLIIAVCLIPAKAGLDDDIVKLLEDFRVRMCHPIPKYGIPALDPFEIAHDEVYLDGTIFKDFSASVTNLIGTGISDFIINQVKVSTLTQKFTFDFTFPLTSVQTQYTAKGSIAHIINLVGDEEMVGHIKEFRIIITGAMKIGLSFGIKNLKILFYVNELFVDFGQLMEHDRINTFFHNLINELAVELLGDFWEDYGETYTAALENVINTNLSGYSLKDIIAIISGEPIFGDDPPGDCRDKIIKEKVPSVILHQMN